MEIKSRLLTAVAVAGLVATACSSTSASPSAAAVDWKTATSAGAGGVDAVCAAAKAEGQVNIIATPPDWANYGQIINDFSAKYGIKVQSDQPDADSQTEIDTAKQLAGTGRQPDLFDLGGVVALANTAVYAPYQVATWADIPAANKEPTGLWVNNYTGFETIGYDASLGTITKVADLADPKYKGKVALNGDPLKASAGFNGVVMASLANGGSADNIQPGIDFMKKLSDMGNLLPVDPNPATIASGQTPIVIDWTYNNAAQADPLSKKGVTWKTVIPTDAAPVAAYYNSAINKDAPHPAAARCWMEYVFSDAGQNAWLKGFAIPIRLSAMQKAGTLDQAAFTALNPPTTTPVMLTADQITAAKKALTTSWTFITIK